MANATMCFWVDPKRIAEYPDNMPPLNSTDKVSKNMFNIYPLKFAIDWFQMLSVVASSPGDAYGLDFGINSMTMTIIIIGHRF